MHKYLTLFGTSLIIFFALFVIFSHNVFATATAYSCADNIVNTDTNYFPWLIYFNANCITPPVICDNDDKPCATPTPTPSVTSTPTPTPTQEVTPTPTTAPSTNTGGPGDGRSDGLGCGSHDCSSHPSAPQGQVLGATTGPQVLGLSTTSGEENFLPQLIQALGAVTAAGLGIKFFKKNA